MLVDYGSDSGSDNEPLQPVQAHSKPDAIGGGLQLPAPKAKSKKDKGPVKISLTDVSSAQTQQSNEDEENEQRAKKRPKLGLGSGGGGLGGLASMLPAPKKDTVKPAAGFAGAPSSSESQSKAAESEQQQPTEESLGPSAMVPKAVKRKAAAPAAQTAAQPDEAEDLFGLGSVTAVTSAPSTSSSSATASAPSTSTSASKSFSAAPVIQEKPKQNYYATLPPASPDNPYPGFHCIPQTGQWEPDQPQDWAEWAEMHGWAPSRAAASGSNSTLDAPRGFEGANVGDMSDVSAQQQRQEAEASREAAAASTSKAAYVDPKEEEEKKLKLAKLQQGAGRAGRKNQLSSLLSNAIAQRSDLEERIATSKQNKRSGGKKYGF